MKLEELVQLLDLVTLDGNEVTFRRDSSGIMECHIVKRTGQGRTIVTGTGPREVAGIWALEDAYHYAMKKGLI